MQLLANIKQLKYERGRMHVSDKKRSCHSCDYLAVIKLILQVLK